MATPGKEIEPRQNYDEQAVREVENYIERVEKQSESSAQVQQTTVTTANVTQNLQRRDMGAMVSAQFSQQQKPKIILPLRRDEVEEGLHRKVIDGFKWLAEWCVLMIKKYPGRVFYLPPTQ